MNRTILVFMIMYVITTVATFIAAPHMVDKFKEHPWLAVVPLFNVLAIANIPREISRGREMRAFLSSCLSIAALMTLFGLGMYPYLILAEPVANSLDLYFAASSQLTLKIMLIVAGIGMPLVLSYTVCIYWIFRGKVKLNEYSY